MRWEGQRESDNVEDRRSGGGGGFGIGGRSIGIGTIVLALIGWGVFGINPLTTIGVLSGGGGSSQQQQGPAQAPPANDRNAAFVSTVLASTEDVGPDLPAGRPALPGAQAGAVPRRHAHGLRHRAVGHGAVLLPGRPEGLPGHGLLRHHDAPAGAPGEFARAYVVAHEVGHHVQNLQGITGKVDSMRGRTSAAQQNALSVRLELQADCYAGIWANRSKQAKQWLDAGDIESAINAAQQIGDDTLQKRSQGYAVPDSFTHGSSAQRVRWFTQGYKTGSVQSCDTFNAQGL
jgi:predicted metalloprotease